MNPEQLTQTLDTIIDRLDNYERRLAAIERAATCGIGPNEPSVISPAQAAVGEASAVLTEPTPELLAYRIECERLQRDNVDLRQQLATAREAAEAMEWLALNPDRTLIYGFNYSDRKGWCIEGTCFGVYPTPTAAILAARDAGGTNTGEKK